MRLGSEGAGADHELWEKLFSADAYLLLTEKGRIGRRESVDAGKNCVCVSRSHAVPTLYKTAIL